MSSSRECRRNKCQRTAHKNVALAVGIQRIPQWVAGPDGEGARHAANRSLASANCTSFKTQSSGSKGVPGMAGDKNSLRISHAIPAASNRLRSSPISALFGEEKSRFIILQSCRRRKKKVSDGSQPPMTFDLSLSESAGSRSLDRLVGLAFTRTF